MLIQNKTTNKGHYILVRSHYQSTTHKYMGEYRNKNKPKTNNVVRVENVVSSLPKKWENYSSFQSELFSV